MTTEKELIEETLEREMDSVELEIYENMKTTSMSTVGKGAKLNRLSGGMAVQIAKKVKDPDYGRMIKAKALYIKCKAKIMSKYKTKGRAAAMKAARS